MAKLRNLKDKKVKKIPKEEIELFNKVFESHKKLLEAIGRL